MTLQAANRLTAAETQLIEAYTSQIGNLPGDGAVILKRDGMFDALKRQGLPTRRVETFHYTDLKALMRAIPSSDTFQSAEAVQGLVAEASVLNILQGVAQQADTLPAGVSLELYRDQLSNGAAVEGLTDFGGDDTIGRINGAFVRDGFELTVADGVELAQPVEFQSVHGAGHVHLRYPARFGKGAKATVIERHVGKPDAAAFVSVVSDLTLEDGAEVTWVIVNGEGNADTHLAQVRASIGTDAKFRLFVINTGGKLVRQEVHVKTAGEGSDFTLRGVNLLGGDTHTDVTMTLGHDVPNTTSTEIIRNVVFDRARGVFQGMIRVAPDAQKTDARMACNTLLMSDDAEFSVKPELEIFADDVQCAHGATVTDIHADHLYYLMSRGIPEKAARGLLINGFVAEVVEELEDEALVEALEEIIWNWLEHHG